MYFPAEETTSQRLAFVGIFKTIGCLVWSDRWREDIFVAGGPNYVKGECAAIEFLQVIGSYPTALNVMNGGSHCNIRIHHEASALPIVGSKVHCFFLGFFGRANDYFVGRFLCLDGWRPADVFSLHYSPESESSVRLGGKESCLREKIWKCNEPRPFFRTEMLLGLSDRLRSGVTGLLNRRGLLPDLNQRFTGYACVVGGCKECQDTPNGNSRLYAKIEVFADAFLSLGRRSFVYFRLDPERRLWQPLLCLVLLILSFLLIAYGVYALTESRYFISQVSEGSSQRRRNYKWLEIPGRFLWL